MIHGIGVDLVNINRMERVIRRWGDRFTGRVFTIEEAGKCFRRATPYPAFALRFAAKEAFSKALGSGMARGLKGTEIEVVNDQGGKPGLKLYGTSFEICHKNGITGIYLSLSDDGQYGVAMVILECNGGKSSC